MSLSTSLLTKIVRFVLPVDTEDDLPEDTDWADCELAFEEGLALGVLKPELAQRVFEEILSEQSELEQSILGLMDIAKGRKPLSLSEADEIVGTDMVGAVEDLAVFIDGELKA